MNKIYFTLPAVGRVAYKADDENLMRLMKCISDLGFEIEEVTKD